MMERRRLAALLKSFEWDVLKECSQALMGNAYRARRSKADLVRDLEGRVVKIDDIAVTLQRMASTTWTVATGAPVPLVQYEDTILGPLGLVKSNEGRTPSSAREMVNDVLLRVVPEPHLQRIANHIDHEKARSTLIAAASGDYRALLLAQICLQGAEHQLRNEINDAVHDCGPLKIEDAEVRSACGWLLTRWGVLVEPEHSVEECTAQLLSDYGGARLDAALSNIPGSSKLERCLTYVVMHGPAATLERFLSASVAWELLSQKGLTLPSEGPPDALRGTLLAYVGLWYPEIPDGLFRQRDDLIRDLESSHSGDDGVGRTVRELKRFEAGIARAFIALVAVACDAADEVGIRKLLESASGLALLRERRVLKAGGKRPLWSMTFGQRQQIFKELLDTLAGQSEAVTRLHYVGRDPDDVRDAFVSDAVQQVIALRNDVAHRPLPPWTDVRGVLLQALDRLTNYSTAFNGPVAPIAVRRLEERTDATGWTRCEFEDERGRRILAAGVGWFPGPGPYYLVARAAPALCKPCLIPIENSALAG